MKKEESGKKKRAATAGEGKKPEEKATTREVVYNTWRRGEIVSSFTIATPA